ncbi:MAG: 4Fe-4S dicluster domain-containing protein [Pseudomonadota bacterium]
MSEFIRVEIDFQKCVGIKECGECIGVCPVNIFGKKADHPAIIEENQDECTLCDLCVEACNPDAIAIKKLYEE